MLRPTNQRRRTNRRFTRRCAFCGSDRVILEAALITGQRYHCLACDYVGPLVVETEDRPPTDSSSPP